MENQETRKPRGWRKANLGLLGALYGVLAAAAFWIAPGKLGEIEALKVPLPLPAVVALGVFGTFQQLWYVYGLVMGGLGTFGLTGALDKLIKPLTILVFLLGAAVGGLAVYTHSLPDLLRREAQEQGLDLFRRK